MAEAGLGKANMYWLMAALNTERLQYLPSKLHDSGGQSGNTKSTNVIDTEAMLFEPPSTGVSRLLFDSIDPISATMRADWSVPEA